MLDGGPIPGRDSGAGNPNDVDPGVEGGGCGCTILGGTEPTALAFMSAMGLGLAMVRRRSRRKPS